MPMPPDASLVPNMPGPRTREGREESTEGGRGRRGGPMEFMPYRIISHHNITSRLRMHTASAVLNLTHRQTQRGVYLLRQSEPIICT